MDITIIVDGGSLGNGSKDSVGYGSFIAYPTDEKTYPVAKKQHRLSFGTGVTNHEAEYLSLISSLKFAADVITATGLDTPTVSISVQSDSALVIGQLSKDWNVKASNLRPLFAQATELCNQFKAVEFNKIPEAEMKKILGH
jgi:ribonuclease HI